MRKIVFISITLIFINFSTSAVAEFIISSAIVDFNRETGKQQDIELVSRSRDTDYIVSDIYTIDHPGEPGETRKKVEDPVEAGLLVTPDKTVLAGGSRKILRFILLREPANEDRIYRVDIKPVIRGINSNDKIGIKILVGYGVLVIVRPQEIKPAFTIRREGKALLVANNGNSNILLQGNEQCPSDKDADKKECKIAPAMRVYAGGKAQLALPFDRPVTYTIWDGLQSLEKKF